MRIIYSIAWDWPRRTQTSLARCLSRRWSTSSVSQSWSRPCQSRHKCPNRRLLRTKLPLASSPRTQRPQVVMTYSVKRRPTPKSMSYRPTALSSRVHRSTHATRPSRSSCPRAASKQMSSMAESIQVMEACTLRWVARRVVKLLSFSQASLLKVRDITRWACIFRSARCKSSLDRSPWAPSTAPMARTGSIAALRVPLMPIWRSPALACAFEGSIRHSESLCIGRLSLIRVWYQGHTQVWSKSKVRSEVDVHWLHEHSESVNLPETDCHGDSRAQSCQSMWLQSNEKIAVRLILRSWAAYNG